jgi:DsbC/DsbD-like thiol-disulfide interchange protein
MRLLFYYFTILYTTTLPSYNCEAQDSSPISWTCQWNYVSGRKGTIAITASLAPGWHLYSQNIAEGGPIPTRLEFLKSDDFDTVGKAEEHGKPFTYYDSLYEMSITTYAYEVAFLQKISLNKPKATVKCKAAFMLCNDNQCIPSKESFTIPVSAN